MFLVYDCYEGEEFIGTADTIQEVRELARERWKETDGECAIWYETNGKKKFLAYF